MADCRLRYPYTPNTLFELVAKSEQLFKLVSIQVLTLIGKARLGGAGDLT